MYALVAWSFTDGSKARKHFFTYNVSVSNLKMGDIVYVEDKNNANKMGTFYKYIDQDINLWNLKRVDILKKVHTNRLKSVISTRYNLYKDFYIHPSKKARRSRRKEAKLCLNTNHKGFQYYKIIRALCLGNLVEKDDNLNFYFENLLVVLQREKDGFAIRKIKMVDEPVKWIRSNKLESILVKLMQSDPDLRTQL